MERGKDLKVVVMIIKEWVIGIKMQKYKKTKKR